jgi:hypothetical protein
LANGLIGLDHRNDLRGSRSVGVCAYGSEAELPSQPEELTKAQGASGSGCGGRIWWNRLIDLVQAVDAVHDDPKSAYARDIDILE